MNINELKENTINHSVNVVDQIEKELYFPKNTTQTKLNIFSIAIGVVGIIISIFTSCFDNYNDKLFLALLIGIWSVLFFITGFLFNKAQTQINHSIDIARAESKAHENWEKEFLVCYNLLDNAYSHTNDAYYLTTTNLWKSLNKINCVRAEIESCDASQEKTEQLSLPQMNQLKRSYYRHYHAFIIDMLNKTKDIVETYLQGKGNTYSVSVALKLFSKPVDTQDIMMHLSDQFIYTAFRDTKTYESGERSEFSKTLFSIAKNSDFLHCANGHSYYIFNSKDTLHSSDYENENAKAHLFYNSGVTVPVRTEGESFSLQSISYGFLACDIKSKGNTQQKIMDKNVAYILMNIASMIAFYCKTINDLYENDIISNNNEKNKISFQEYAYRMRMKLSSEFTSINL